MGIPQHYACLDGDNTIQTVVIWDGEAEWAPVDGLKPILLTNALASGFKFAKRKYK